VSDLSGKLCLACGLCCNGVIFADVQLQRGDDIARLKSVGLLKAKNAKKFAQPCSMHDGCRCSIYKDRPRYCREFECLLLKNAQEGRVSEPEATRVINDALKKAARVRDLLSELGDDDLDIALSKRFQSTRRRIENGPATAEQIDIFGSLTVAVHELNVILSERFYR
jgi:Fe-S-cluster containining protein